MILDSLLSDRLAQPESCTNLNSLAKAIGLPLRIFSIHGDPLWEHDVGSRINVCRILCTFEKGRKLCLAAQNKGVQEAIRWGEPYIGECCAMLMQISVPIMKEGKVHGCLTAAPFLMGEISDMPPEKLSSFNKFARKREELMKALSHVPIKKEEDIGQAAKKVFQLADLFSFPDLGCLLKVREIQKLQGKIADRICDLKNSNKDFEMSSLTRLSYEHEKELIARIRLRDEVGAKEILYGLLAIILTQHLDNFELLKIAILELFIVLSRTAVETGARLEEILGMKYAYVTELASIKDQENFCLWIVQVFEKLIAGIQKTMHDRNDERLKKALKFIEANYSAPLTIEEIAKQVCLSPSRLSHITRNQLGLTLRDYITKTRINRAKALLINSEMSIAQIACEVGFADQSYFTKSFKNVEKCTPKVFRRNGLRPVLL